MIVGILGVMVLCWLYLTLKDIAEETDCDY